MIPKAKIQIDRFRATAASRFGIFGVGNTRKADRIEQALNTFMVDNNETNHMKLRQALVSNRLFFTQGEAKSFEQVYDVSLSETNRPTISICSSL